MGWAGEIADFSAGYEKSRKKLQESDVARKPKDPTPSAGIGAKAALFGPPETVDNKDKGYAYYKGGLVRKR
jgi:hypothetical protein